MTGAEGNVDDGTFGAKVYELAKVGGHWFPAIADRLADSVLSVHRATEWIRAVSGAAGDPPALREVLDHCSDLQAHLLRSMRPMAATGEALIDLANHFIATDEQARADYERLQRTHPFPLRPTSTGDSLPRPGDPPTGRGTVQYI
ncbi:hypothetical protein HNR19_000354 [Nocardioides thalensis]|uniref:Uncharacterized protein n=1 Tax=Nocardioides thalensis TaxID=1914755 RepID=A0A853BY18_9ACTN|nr:hypothetical protein [Nocardioides thalensis]NYI99655.1 hypothetical protein [Nocardioides thalensis]